MGRKTYTKKNPKPLTKYEKIVERNRRWKERRKRRGCEQKKWTLVLKREGGKKVLLLKSKSGEFVEYKY